MNARKLIDLLKNPQTIAPSDLEELARLVKEYPYFSVGHLTYLKGLKRVEDPRFSSVLPLAATHAPSVEWLYLFLNSDNNVQAAEAPDVMQPAEAEMQPVIPAEPPNVEAPAAADEVAEEVVASDAHHEQPETSNIVETAAAEPEKAEAESEPTVEPSAPVEAEAEGTPLAAEPAQETERTTDSEINTTVVSADDEDIFEFIEDDLKSEQQSDDPIFEILDQKLYTLDEPASSLEMQNNLIDQFLTSMPRIVPKGEFPPVIEDISASSLVDDGEIVTEMLAKIYAGQGLNAKAMEVYEKLILKFPEKRAYFVAELEKLKELK